MIAPIILSLAVLIYTAVHSLLASIEVKAWVHYRWGPQADRGYRLAYNIFAVISGLPILALFYILPDQPLYRISFPWIVLATLGQLIGIVVIVVGIQQTDLWHFVGLRQFIKSENRASSVMIVTGLYAWVRHPLYTGGLLLIWLMPKMTLNLLTIFFWLTVYLIVGARLEEKRLIHEFGDAYREYQQRVPMLIPRLHRIK